MSFGYAGDAAEIGNLHLILFVMEMITNLVARPVIPAEAVISFGENVLIKCFKNYLRNLKSSRYGCNFASGCSHSLSLHSPA